MEIPKDLKDNIWEYCRLNDITNMNDFMVKLLRQGFTAEKFGATPLGLGKAVEPEPQIIERIVEKIVEVPITVIDPTLSEDMKQHIELIEKLKQDLIASIDISNVLREELEACKTTKVITTQPRDIYGEDK